MAHKSIKKNYIYNLLFQVFTAITPVITAPYLSRVLGADGIGKISFAESVVSYFVILATLGISTYGQREVSYVQNDKENRSIVFYNTFVTKFIVSLIVIIIYILLSIFVFKSVLQLILTLNLLAVLVDVAWFFQGMEDFGKIVLRSTIFKVLTIICIFVFIKKKENVLLYALIIEIFGFLCNASLILFLPKYINKIDFSKLNPFKDISVIFMLFVPTIAIQICTALDKTMIGIITKSEFENGYYEQAMKIPRILLYIVTTLALAVMPRIGLLFNNGEKKEIENLMYKSYRFVFLISLPMACGLFAVAPNFVPWFFGDGYDKSIVLIRILAFLLIIIGISNITGMQYMIPTKRQNLLSISVCIGAVINFILNYFLIIKYASFGAAIASIISELVIMLLEFYIVRKELSFVKIICEAKKYYFSSLIMLVVLCSISTQLKPSIINTILIILIGVISYIGLLFIMKDIFFVESMKMIINSIQNRNGLKK